LHVYKAYSFPKRTPLNSGAKVEDDDEDEYERAPPNAKR
jgi:hypothetical protein